MMSSSLPPTSPYTNGYYNTSYTSTYPASPYAPAYTSPSYPSYPSYPSHPSYPYQYQYQPPSQSQPQPSPPSSTSSSSDSSPHTSQYFTTRFTNAVTVSSLAGWVEALGQGGTTWKRKYFEVRDNFLVYSSSPDAPKPDWVIALEGGSVQRSPDYTLCLELTCGHRRYHLRFPDEITYEQWSAAIEYGTKLTIHTKYELGEQLGVGTFSVVRRARHRQSGREHAIKIINKNDVHQHRHSLMTEIAILQRVRHRHIVRVYEIFENQQYLYVVTELLIGGELFDRIMQVGVFSERDASILIRQIVSGIAYLHSHGIVHRDLKPENLLYAAPSSSSDSETALGEVKIADFGLSKFWDPKRDRAMRTACGTPTYVAPEVLAMTGYTRAVDMWGVGVILYILLCGFPPFYGENDPQLYDMIKRGQYDMPDPFWTNISKSAKDLVSQLLRVDPTQRLTAEECLLHPWIAHPQEARQDDLVLIKDEIARLVARRRLKRGYLGVVAARRFSQTPSSTTPSPSTTPDSPHLMQHSPSISTFLPSISSHPNHQRTSSSSSSSHFISPPYHPCGHQHNPSYDQSYVYSNPMSNMNVIRAPRYTFEESPSHSPNLSSRPVISNTSPSSSTNHTPTHSRNASYMFHQHAQVAQSPQYPPPSSPFYPNGNPSPLFTSVPSPSPPSTPLALSLPPSSAFTPPSASTSTAPHPSYSYPSHPPIYPPYPHHEPPHARKVSLFRAPSSSSSTTSSPTPSPTLSSQPTPSQRTQRTRSIVSLRNAILVESDSDDEEPTTSNGHSNGTSHYLHPQMMPSTSTSTSKRTTPSTTQPSSQSNSSAGSPHTSPSQSSRTLQRQHSSERERTSTTSKSTSTSTSTSTTSKPTSTSTSTSTSKPTSTSTSSSMSNITVRKDRRKTLNKDTMRISVTKPSSTSTNASTSTSTSTSSRSSLPASTSTSSSQSTNAPARRRTIPASQPSTSTSSRRNSAYNSTSNSTSTSVVVSRRNSVDRGTPTPVLAAAVVAASVMSMDKRMDGGKSNSKSTNTTSTSSSTTTNPSTSTPATTGRRSSSRQTINTLDRAIISNLNSLMASVRDHSLSPQQSTSHLSSRESDHSRMNDGFCDSDRMNDGMELEERYQHSHHSSSSRRKTASSIPPSSVSSSSSLSSSNLSSKPKRRTADNLTAMLSQLKHGSLSPVDDRTSRFKLQTHGTTHVVAPASTSQIRTRERSASTGPTLQHTRSKSNPHTIQHVDDVITHVEFPSSSPTESDVSSPSSSTSFPSSQYLSPNTINRTLIRPSISRESSLSRREKREESQEREGGEE